MMKKLRIEIKWAVIFALVTLGWMLLERLVGLHDEHISKHAIYSSLFAIPAIAVYVFALLDKRKNFFNGFITYKQAFASGLIITFIVAALSPLTQYITTTVITPDFFNNIITYTVDQGVLTQEAAADQFNLKSYIVQGFFGALFMGIITSAIVSVFIKKNPKKQEVPATKESVSA